MVANGKDDGQSAPEEGLPVDKVRNLVRDIKEHAQSLEEAAHAEELEGHVARIETELAREEPHHATLASLLDGLRGLSVEANQVLVKSGAMTLLNEILGTGVPPTGP
ncbi:hypothetical protein SAMN05444161_1693 [Rhizobiales bacterium GAS191]|jgi:hypothetical protein|nr:hypothetical protein SAMN05519104_1624 [Rhizobiales bacterium GAS188]SEC71691.1 hypothetical protein SAMN05444161_1693 [Rhizobiales bacterium GAS191]